MVGSLRGQKDGSQPVIREKLALLNCLGLHDVFRVPIHHCIIQIESLDVSHSCSFNLFVEAEVRA